MSVTTCEDSNAVDPVRAYRVDKNMQELAPSERIETREWLIQEQNSSPRRECDGKSHLRPLTTGELAGRLVERHVEFV